MKIEYRTLIDGLRGIPITNLVENWSFTIDEIAPYTFKAQGRDANWHTVVGYGASAEHALNSCIKKAKKIILRENRRLILEKWLSKIWDKIKSTT